MSETQTKRTRGRPRTLEKAGVTEVAMNAYWENGPTEVSLNAICQKAGVSKPSVYREFGNDDGLTHAALLTYADKVLKRTLEITQSDDSFQTKLARLAYLSAEDPLHDQGCLFVKMRAAKTRMGPKTQALIADIDSMALAAFSDVLAEAHAAGDLPRGIPVDLGARYLQAQVGLALDQRARGEDPRATMALALSIFDTRQKPVAE